MSLYDDFDAIKQKSNEVAGWSKGMKLFQTQLQAKKAASSGPKREIRKVTSVLAPVFDLNSRTKEDDEYEEPNSVRDSSLLSQPSYLNDLDWSCEEAEYDPLWPNDYEKVVKDLRELRDKEKEREDEERLRRREEKRQTRFDPPSIGLDDVVKEEDRPRTGGVAIAPPPSLTEQVVIPPQNKAFGASVAAKIMAKYGFKEGQGLGKKEQGISMALQVEKTSKRGGRIIHEKDMLPPPPPVVPYTDEEDMDLQPPPKPEVSITEIMKSPSKVVLLKNMVGPGEVDQDLEPEVKDECNTKYGEVGSVVIHELPSAQPEEAVRIFVEFKRIESAIKAVVDLNGRFFGGRQVKAGFYPQDKFENFQLLENT